MSYLSETISTNPAAKLAQHFGVLPDAIDGYSPAYVAAELARRSAAPKNLQVFLGAMLLVGLENCRLRGYATIPTHVVFHLPMEVVATAMGGVCQRTIRRWSAALHALGYLDWRLHYGKFRKATSCTGTVWAVRLSGPPAKLRYDDLNHPWRDLERDIAAGNTAYQLYKNREKFKLSESINDPKMDKTTTLLLTWGCCGNSNSKMVNLTRTNFTRADLYEIGAAATAADRRSAVDHCARIITAAVGDSLQNLNCWRSVLWAGLRENSVQRRKSALHYLQNLVIRAHHLRRETAKNAAAWLVWQLKGAPTVQAHPPADSKTDSTMPVHDPATVDYEKVAAKVMSAGLGVGLPQRTVAANAPTVQAHPPADSKTDSSAAKACLVVYQRLRFQYSELAQLHTLMFSGEISPTDVIEKILRPGIDLGAVAEELRLAIR